MLVFGGLSFTNLPDNTIEINNNGVKVSLNYSNVLELISWLETAMRHPHTTQQLYNPPRYMPQNNHGLEPVDVAGVWPEGNGAAQAGQ